MTGDYSHGMREAGAAVLLRKVLRWFLCFLALSITPDGFTNNVSAEGQLRAAVAVGVLRFTSWTDEADPESPDIQICLWGQPYAGPFLLPVSGQAYVGKKVLQVLDQPQSPALERCQAIIFGPSITGTQSHSLFELARQQGALTICDGCIAPVAAEVMVALKLDHQRVRFEVNLDKAKAARVHLDASLLELAAVVRQ